MYRSRFTHYLTCLLTASLVAAVGVAPAAAQETGISGRVTDQTGAALPGVTVEAESTALSNGNAVTVTDGEGRYLLDDLDGGAYSVSFTLSGFEAFVQTGVTVASGQPAMVDAVLALATLAEEVIVQASKLDTGRQELGSSVAYLSEARIEAEAIYNVEDVFDRTANAFTGTAEFGAYSIRGINNRGLSGSFTNSNALASILLNETALSPRSGDYLKPSLFDASSVEILRGPQSTLQGPNSLIGSVRINYNRPSFSGYAGRARVETGELGTLRAAVMQNVELVDDVLALRATFESRDARGATTNITTGDDDVQRTDETSTRLQLALRPFADDRLNLNVTWIHNVSDSNPYALVAPNAEAGVTIFDRQQVYDRPDEYPSEIDLVNVEGEWSFGDSWSLASVSSYLVFHLDQRFDGDLTPFPLLAVEAFGEDTAFTQELRLVRRGDAVNAVLGAFATSGAYNFGFEGAGVFPDGMGGVRPFRSATDLNEEVNQYSLFGHAEWSLGDRVLATTGLRLNRETRHTDNLADNDGLVSDLTGSETFDQLIPSASLSFEVTDTTRLGGSYARGFQAGGIAFAVFLGQAQSYGEEFTNNYEVFLRHRAPDGRFTLNANLFQIDWFDQQVPYTPEFGFPGFDVLIANVGESRVRGFEVESEFYVTRNVSFFGSLGRNDSEFINFVLDGQDLGGQAFPQSPGWNASTGLAFGSDAGWFASGAFSFVDEAYTDLVAEDITTVSSRELLSARLGYRFAGVSLYAWGTNLLDDQYELGLFDGRLLNIPGAYGRVGEPRVVGLGIEYGW
ncbi:MAG: TonB-dependent receptor [Acidobacteriota bacterium]|nr:TonB-dependent receptor [Acidobacteriota bacterium]